MTTPAPLEVQPSAARAAELKQRLLRAATSLSQRPFLDAEVARIDRTWSLPPNADPVRRVRLVREAAIERLVYAPEAAGARSLVVRVLEGDAGAPFHLDDADRAILESWRAGGVEDLFEVVRDTGRAAELRCLEDELTYRTVDPSGEGGLRRGSLLAGRLVPVEAGWMLATPPKAFAPWHRVEAYRDALSLVVRQPHRQYRNPELKSMAAKLVARHHRVFERLFGGDVVEGSLDELVEHLDRFEDAIGSDGETFLHVEVTRDLEWLEATGADRAAGRGALLHHPVKGPRVVAAYAALREAHESGEGDPQHLRRLLEDPMLPSWVPARLAERHPRHVAGIYGRALARDGFTAEDLPGYLAEREPAVDPSLPGVVLVPAWVSLSEVA